MTSYRVCAPKQDADCMEIPTNTVTTKYRGGLPGLCRRQGASVLDVRCLRARFAGGRFTVTLGDQRGRRIADDYYGISGACPRLLAPRGEIRRKRVPFTRAA